ncbi:hypothetical protein DERP_013574, partial [Dermatophagoides pteronyssinus]
MIQVQSSTQLSLIKLKQPLIHISNVSKLNNDKHFGTTAIFIDIDSEPKSSSPEKLKQSIRGKKSQELNDQKTSSYDLVVDHIFCKPATMLEF